MFFINDKWSPQSFLSAHTYSTMRWGISNLMLVSTTGKIKEGIFIVSLYWYSLWNETSFLNHKLWLIADICIPGCYCRVLCISFVRLQTPGTKAKIADNYRGLSKKKCQGDESGLQGGGGKCCMLALVCQGRGQRQGPGAKAFALPP